jgi:glycosyltransferase involved in cell wall biosynthesis
MKLALCYKSISKCPSHVGLGNSCRNTMNVLKQNGMNAEVWPIIGGDDLQSILKTPKGNGVTHVAIAAPFIPSDWMQRLAQEFQHITFAVISHSNVGFLQAESAAIRLMRAYCDLSVYEHNFHAAGNNSRLVEAFNDAYGRYVLYLPNMYDLKSTPKFKAARHFSSPIRIGSFGALRVQKNFTSAAWAAISIARNLRVDLEFYVHMGRTDNNGNVVENAIRASLEKLDGVKLIEVPWQDAVTFRRTVARMNLLLQPSYTETFSMVTADAIAEGVPVVVTPAVEWVPKNWQADSDNVSEITKVGLGLLRDPHSAECGYQALLEYNKMSLQVWSQFLK